MHDQSFGYPAFCKGEEFELLNVETLLPVLEGKVVTASLDNPHEMILKLNCKIPSEVKALKNVVIDNVTWCPEVRIAGNRFWRIPTRGVLLTTRHKSVIENNYFYGMQMSAILVNGDALQWFESGRTNNLVIRNNYFIECGDPIIYIIPTYTEYEGPVHKNITIEKNVFESSNPAVRGIYAQGVGGLVIRDNYMNLKNQKNTIDLKDCTDVINEH